MTTAVETKLYVTNFPSSATRQQLQQFFSRFGRVQECAIMWNSYAFVHYASMEEARRALDQSNGAMFLNRKLIVQLSTSRFRPQPKEMNISIPQSSPPPPKQLMIINPSSHQSIEGSQQSNLLTYSDLLFRPPSPLSQDININNYYSQYSTVPINHMKINKNLKADTGTNGELPKLYCTNLPDNCTANELQRLFSSFGHVVDCVILWDYYAFITYKTFPEAERALIGLNGFIWKDRNLIVEWSRASGRRQQQQTSPPPRLGVERSTPSSPSRPRPSTLSVSNNQFFRNTSPSFNQNLALMSMMQQQQQQPFVHQHTSIPNDSNHHHHHLDLSPFIDTNSSSIFSSSSELNTPSSIASASNVYQPSDIVTLLEPSSSSNVSNNNKSSINDSTNTLSSTCSSAALAQENLLSSLFNSFEPFNKFYSNDDQSSSRYNHFSSLLTTAPDNNHYPISYGHNISWH